MNRRDQEVYAAICRQQQGFFRHIIIMLFFHLVNLKENYLLVSKCGGKNLLSNVVSRLEAENFFILFD